MEDNTPIEKQIDILAEYIMKEYPEEITGGGAIEVAMRILDKHKHCTD